MQVLFFYLFENWFCIDFSRPLGYNIEVERQTKKEENRDVSCNVRAGWKR